MPMSPSFLRPCAQGFSGLRRYDAPPPMAFSFDCRPRLSGGRGDTETIKNPPASRPYSDPSGRFVFAENLRSNAGRMDT